MSTNPRPGLVRTALTLVCLALAPLVVPAMARASDDLALVAGATGGTGTHIVEELLDQGFRVRAFVRDRSAAEQQFGERVDYAVGDVRERDTIDAALDGVDDMIIAIGAGRGDPANGPEFVDYGGVKNLAEAGAKAGLDQIVLISSVGVTDEDHVLNRMFDNVLRWKARGEQALRESGVAYTIVRPGGLVNEPGGESPVRFEQGDTGAGVIPREDVAKICVAALMYPGARNRTFEVFRGEGEPGNDWAQLFAGLGPDASVEQ